MEHVNVIFGTIVQLSYKYEVLGDFIRAMVGRIEMKEEKYGDWRQIDADSVYAHLMEEVRELQQNPESADEAVDIANLCFMYWALLKHRIVDQKVLERASIRAGFTD